jgi:hypothetical protein
MAKHKLDELFSDSLENFEASPAPAAWEAIESRLDQKKGWPAWGWMGIAATAALVLTSSWLMFTQTEETAAEVYTYNESSIEELVLPTEVIYVPIYIHTVIEQPKQIASQPVKPSVATQKPVIVEEEPVVLASTKEIPVEQPEIITLEDVPLVTAEEVLMASAESPDVVPPALAQPVTIIYKQGEPAKESNFVKAMNYMEEVRMGEKKLVNFEKLRNNLRSRFRSEEGTD